MSGTEDRFDAEEKAQLAMVELMRQAREVRNLFLNAGMPIPTTLARLFDTALSAATASSSTPKLIVSAPQGPVRPRGAKDDWISVPIPQLGISTLLLGVLRESGGVMDNKQRLAKLTQYQPGLNYGSSLNVGARLDGEVIEKTEEGWRLMNDDLAPILHEGNAWGPVNVFYPHELAVHRRCLILHFLRATGGSMQLTQLLKMMIDSGQCKTALNKDTIKSDVMALNVEKKIVGNGSPRKWKAI